MWSEIEFVLFQLRDCLADHFFVGFLLDEVKVGRVVLHIGLVGIDAITKVE